MRNCALDVLVWPYQEWASHGNPTMYLLLIGVHLTIVYEWWYPLQTEALLMTPPTLHPYIKPETSPQTGGPKLHPVYLTLNLPPSHNNDHLAEDNMEVLFVLTLSSVRLDFPE